MSIKTHAIYGTDLTYARNGTSVKVTDPKRKTMYTYEIPDSLVIENLSFKKERLVKILDNEDSRFFLEWGELVTTRYVHIYELLDGDIKSPTNRVGDFLGKIQFKLMGQCLLM